MAEFAAATGAIGIVSLGLQVAGGLLKYYRSWRDIDNNISDICISLDGLLGSLTKLHETLERREASGSPKDENVDKSIKNAHDAINQLHKELQKIKPQESSKLGVRAAMRKHARRLLYPFREETLNHIKDAVSEARSNLAFTLDILQMFV